MTSYETDPRDIITQDAFHVDADLLGTPLATPKRRLAALLLDLLLASILGAFGGFWLGLAVAIVFFRVATRKALDHPLKRWMRTSLAIFGALVLFGTTYALVGNDEEDDDDDDEMTEVLAEQGVVTASSMDYAAFGERMAALAQVTGDSGDVQDVMAELESSLGSLMPETVPDSLGPEERAEGAALLHAYAEALAADDQQTLDSLDSKAATLVAGKRLQQLRAQNDRYDERIDALEDENEELAAAAAHPGIKRIVQAVAEDFGLRIGWIGLYFTLFLTWWNGHTPGKKLFGLRVVRLDGRPITLWMAFERFGGYAAGLATGLLGFFQVFWDANRQGIHDRIAHTAVIRERR